MRRKILIGLTIVVGVPLLVTMVAVLYLNFADLSGWRGTVEDLATDALGRELRIAGVFEPDIGLNTRLVATEVTLANPDGWPEPHMVSVKRLEAELDLMSLLFGPLTINEITADGVQVLLAADAEGNATWQFDIEDDDTGEDTGPLDIVLGHAKLTHVGLVFRDPSLPRTLELTNADLELRPDETGMVDLELEGDLNGAVLDLAGHIGTLGSVLVAGEVEHDLEGRVGNVDLSLKGRIEDLASLGGADIALELDGPDLAMVGDRFGISALPAGPFRIEATASPAPAGSTVDLSAGLGEITARIEGTVDSLTSFDDLDVDVAASGPSIAEVGVLAGLDGLPADPFSVTGRVHWQGFPITFDGFEAKVGDNLLSIEGVLGAPPRMADTDFRVSASGPNIATLAALAGVDLPADDFQIEGHLARVEGGIRVEDVAARIGTTTLSADGIVGDPPGFAGTELTVSAKGPDISVYGGVLGFELPAESFEVGGRLIPDGDNIVLHGVKARLGRNSARLEGKIKATAGLVGTDLRVSAEGPGLRWLEPIVGLDGLPSGSYRVDGGVRILASGYRLNDVKAGLGELSVQVDGRIGVPPGFEGSEVTVQAGGPDVSQAASLAGLTGIPAQAFRVAGAVKVTGEGYELVGIDATLGDVTLNADGRIGNHPDFHGTHVRFDAKGPRLSALGDYVDLSWLPREAFTVSGEIGIAPDGYRLEHVVAELAGHQIEADGRVVASADLIGTNLAISIGGPDLGHAGRMAGDTGLVELPALPAEAYTVSGGLLVDDTGYELRTVDLTLGSAVAHLSGRIGRLPGLQGTDITVDSDGPNASLFTAVTGVDVPVAPFRVHGRVTRPETGYRFDDLEVQLGEYHLTADGRLGEPPRLIGTDFELRAEGPSLELFEHLPGVPPLPHRPFMVDGHFDGNPRRFTSERFAVRLGESDVRGSFRVDLTGKPSLEAVLQSDRIDVVSYLEQRAARRKALADEQEALPATKRDRLFPDTPFELAVLRDANADVVWNVAALQLPVDVFSDIEIDLQLEDDRLQLGPFTATGSSGGRLAADLVLEPAGDAYALNANLMFEGGRFNLSATGGDPGQRPQVDIYIEYSGTGATAHELAASSNGHIAVVMGDGIINDSIVNLVTADILIKLLDTLNPFAKTEDQSLLECAVILTTFDDGIATLEPMAVQTDKMTLLGAGTINLDSEKIKLNWITKPRKGLGLSASMITNPYISLGGTLADPNLAMKPLEALTTTGVAVATGGLSILGKGLYDRITAEAKVCDKATKKGRKILEDRGVKLRK
jgi:uncharacterized protein involved in outer membrane biogenesis